MERKIDRGFGVGRDSREGGGQPGVIRERGRLSECELVGIFEFFGFRGG